MHTESLIEDAIFHQRLDQGFTARELERVKSMASLGSKRDEDEKESDGETQKLPHKLPPYKLFLDGYKCTALHSQPRPNRDPLLNREKRLRTPWTIEVGMFWKLYRRES